MVRLTALSADFVDKLGALYRDSRLNLFKLMCRLPFPGGLPRIKIWLTDIGCGGVLRADRPFRQTDIARKNCDIELSSPNLGYLYQHFSGANALIVNGRYTATRTGRYKLFVLSHLALMASANVRLSLAYVGENLVKIMSNILRRLTKV
jgi:hypothetical protein